MLCGIKSYSTCSNAVFRHWHSPTIALHSWLSSVDDTLFEVCPEICCSGVSSRYYCYGNRTAGSKPIKNLSLSMENWIGYLCAKNNSELCELVNACDINCSSPVFLDTLYEVGTLAVDGWAVTFGTARRGLGRAPARPRPLLASPKCNSLPINGQYTNHRIAVGPTMVRCSAVLMCPLTGQRKNVK